VAAEQVGVIPKRGPFSTNRTFFGPLAHGKGVIRHLGFVVPSISSIAEHFAMSMSTRWDGQIIYDLLPRVSVAFFEPAHGRNPLFELVEPADESSPVSRFLTRWGDGSHQRCYEMDELE
jgi:hypothetical protein